MTTIKERYNSQLSLNVVWIVVGDGILKNVNCSNGSRVSKRDVKSFGSQYVLDGSIQNTCISCIIIWRNAK